MGLAGVRLQAKKFESALTVMQEIRPRVEQVFEDDHLKLISFWTLLSYALEKSGRTNEALAIYEQCYAMGPENWPYDAMYAHGLMFQLYLANEQTEQALAIVPALLETSRIKDSKTALKWLRPVANNLLKHSLTEAAVPVLEEVLRREEEIQKGGDSFPKLEVQLLGVDLKPSVVTPILAESLANRRAELLDAYLSTNRLADANACVLSWIKPESKLEARSLQAALRVSHAFMKSGQVDDAKSLLSSLEQAARKGVTSQSEPFLRLAMADDVRQLALYGDIASQYLELSDLANAERLSRECVTQYESLEQSGRFLLPTQTKQAKNCLGRALLEQSKYDEAEPLLLASLLSEEELSYAAEAIYE